MSKSGLLSAFERSTGPILGGNRRRSSRVFYSAVVLDYVSNPAEYMSQLVTDAPGWPDFGLPGLDSSSLSDDEKIEIEQDGSATIGDALSSNFSSISNRDLIKKLPRNCIIGQVVSDGGSRRSNPEIFYPFFSPHLCMPVNAGEQVWVIYENAGSKDSVGYWISRKPSDLQVDDLNYTHGDRTTLNLSISSEDQSTIATFEGEAVDQPDPFSFPLGGSGNTSNNTLPGESPYNSIIQRAISYQNQFIGEAVPRFTKRAADLVFQGSNNTLISLGQDRGFNADDEGGATGIENNTVEMGTSAAIGRGSIDIVAGRGQDSPTIYSSSGLATRGIDEDISYEEIDKAPEVTGAESNINEGDPDFINDLSRIYVSMLTNADENFDIQIVDIDESGEGPAVVVKSSQVRLLARDDLKIHVGDPDTGASVVIKSDGHMIFIPGTGGVIKLGGEDADRAILCTDGTQSVSGGDSGTVSSTQIGTTAMGAIGLGESTGFGTYATKVLIK